MSTPLDETEVPTTENKGEFVPPSIPSEIQASMWLTNHLMQIRELIENYSGSKKQLIRLLRAVTEHGLVDDPVTLSYNHEKELFDLMANAIHAKMVLYHHMANKDLAEKNSVEKLSLEHKAVHDNGQQIVLPPEQENES